MRWYWVVYLWTLTLLDHLGITPKGLKLFVVALILGILVGAFI